jgi:type I restriction enzyme M protein
MVEILNPQPGCSIYDPAMGSGALLLASLNFVKSRDRSATLFPSGTEKISRLVTLAKMNLALHEYPGEALISGDAFAEIPHDEERPKYDYVISNPPVSQLESNHALLDLASHPAFVFGPPLRYVDLNFIQLTVSCLRPGGSALLLVRLRPLFGSGKEQEIRKRLVEAGCVELVVALPERLLPTTPAACAVLKLRTPIRGAFRPPVKLIDASSEFETDERGKRILSRANIDRILATISSDKVTDGLSILKTTSDLSIRDYNLVPANYLRSNDAQINLGENTVMRR